MAAAAAIHTASATDTQATGPTDRLAQQGARIGYHAQTGRVRYIGIDANTPVQSLDAQRVRSTPTDHAAIHVQRYGTLFGVTDPATQLSLGRVDNARDGRSVARYRQRHQSLPVIGGELLVNMNAAGELLSMHGELSPALRLSTNPAVTAAQAQAIALSATAVWHGMQTSDLQASAATLSIYDPQLLHWRAWPARLVWHLEVGARGLQPVRELVLVDALSGVISLHFNQIHTVRNRLTYDANATATLPGTLVCDESQPDCTSGGNPDADDAHRYAGDTYDFYQSRHARDSIDGNGMALVSTVNFNEILICPNAFWTGAQMVYCAGFARADDVVAHELTHGMTQATSNLLYYYQSGAINESLSDVWGEFVDLTNSSGSDGAAERWQLGEDLPVFGAIRNMRNPEMAPFLDPDRISSPNYYTGPDDNGGVHINSGVNNKAAYLMTDGDTFNGFTVTGIGIDRVAAVYYEAQTNLLTSGADYADLYDALNQACQNLLGTAGIGATDCDQVQAATQAVEMDAGNIAGFNPEAPLCDGQVDPLSLFYDNMENGTLNWDFALLAGVGSWINDSGFATSGTRSLWDQNQGGPFGRISDIAAAFNQDIALPAGGRPFLHFRHAFAFEFAGASAPDGGFLEYSADGGTTWSDAGGLIDAGQDYNGTITTLSDNPNPGRAAFVAESRGYVSTRLELSSLAGQNVRFRWRSSSNFFLAGPLGWVLDDVRVYVCAGTRPVAAAGADQTVAAGAGVTLDGSASNDPDGEIRTYAWVQTAGPAVTLNADDTAMASFTAPGQSANLTLSLTVTDNDGLSDTDTVNVTVLGPPNAPPTADAGADQEVAAGVVVTLDGSASRDTDDGIATYAWAQMDGPTVMLDGADTATATFTAPGASTSLTFTLTVTDGDGSSDTDDVIVTVTAPPNAPPVADAGADRSVTAGASVTLDGGGSHDPEAAPLSYAWTQLSGSQVQFSNASRATVRFTAPSSAGVLRFQLTVTDAAGESDADSVAITVEASSGGGGPSDNSALGPWTLLLLAGGLLVVAINRAAPRTALRKA